MWKMKGARATPPCPCSFSLSLLRRRLHSSPSNDFDAPFLPRSGPQYDDASLAGRHARRVFHARVGRKRREALLHLRATPEENGSRRRESRRTFCFFFSALGGSSKGVAPMTSNAALATLLPPSTPLLLPPFPGRPHAKLSTVRKRRRSIAEAAEEEFPGGVIAGVRFRSSSSAALVISIQLTFLPSKKNVQTPRL